ncbi:hypothetical protein GH714_013584 [Hevea brasiliensis]|uniref:DUF4220 domain-containing protein n=1 Tax=Hevea brasiliensis TaxID=3981 RepID=A0A6A6NH14_HEVBR|nr:hypothetical protein GH714_013584 [Hevea brasiliensis]
MEIFPSTLRKLWKGWELRALVLLSLVLQIILILFGNRRKLSRRIWVRVLLWWAYLMADWVATVVLGAFLNNMGEVYENKREGAKGIDLDADTQLTAFWAPFLLLHLGGPDTTTAYYPEDNELWLMHFLELGVHAGMALYIFLLPWTGSRFSIFTWPMLLSGMVKYGERTWTLRSASNDQFKNSTLTTPDPVPNYNKFMEEFTLMQCEGFYLELQEVIEEQVQVDISSMVDTSIVDIHELLKAHYVFMIIKRLFVGLIFSVQELNNIQLFFKGIYCKNAFKMIVTELGFMYDVLYTKATIINSRKGCCLRFISLTSTCIVLVFLSLSNKHNCMKVDIAITFLLLVIAIFLDMYSVLLLVSSDWTDITSNKFDLFHLHYDTVIYQNW